MRTLNCVLLCWTLAALLSTGGGQCAAANAPSLSIVPVNLAANSQGPTAPNAMAVDPQGNIFLAGIAYPAFPTTPGAAQTQPGGGVCTILVPAYFFTMFEQVPCPDAFVAKLQISGNTANLIWATLLGGPMSDSASAIALDGDGNVYITGSTDSQFPTTSGSYAPGGSLGVFVAKFNPEGSKVIYSTYLPEVIGGILPNNPAKAAGIAVDAAGNAYIAGETGFDQLFVAKLSPDGSARLYNTTLSGANGAYGSAITVDAEGNAYVTGFTSSPDFPVTSGAFQAKLKGNPNAFVAKLDPEGNVVYATFLGGSGNDFASTIQTDAGGYVYVAGTTFSLDFPTTAGSWEPTPVIPEWSSDPPTPGGFAAKLSPDGHSLAWSTYVFTDQNGVPGLALDGAGGAYLAGTTLLGSAVTPSAPQPCSSGGHNFYVAHLNQSGALVDRTYAGTDNFAISYLGLQPPLGLAFAGGGLYFATPENLTRLQFGGPGYSPPPCVSPDVVNAATFVYLGQVAPGEFVSLTGIGMGPETGVANQLSADGTVSTELAGVRVLFDGQPAPLLYVQSQQINAIVPFEVAGRTTTAVQVEYQGAALNEVNPTVGVAAPGLFHLAAGSAAINQDGTLNSPRNPAKIGSIISLYGTGFGQTVPAGITGSLFPIEAATLAPAALMPLEVFIGGVPAPVQYAGAAPGQISGIDQLNVVVPTPQQQNGPAVQVGLNSSVEDPVFLTIYVKP